MRQFAGLVLALLTAACATTAPGTPWRDLPAVVDGPGGEAWLAIHPGGRPVLFGRHDQDWANHRLFMTRYANGAWSAPEPVPFTAQFDAKAPHFAPDGRSILFASTRPRPGETAPAADLNLWRVRWDGARWGEPEMLPAPINSSGDEIDAIEVDNGVIYFTSLRDERRPDLFRAAPADGGYRIELVSGVNTDLIESTLYVAHDESVIVFSRSDDPSGLGSDDLFYTRRQGASWSTPVHLGGAANSPVYDYGPELAPDGHTLFFTTHRDGPARIMAIDLNEALAR